jgi:hypothetical protein
MPKEAFGRADELLYRVSDGSAFRFFLAIFLPLGIIYSLTASWDLPYDPDALSNVVAAWHLGNIGTVIAPGYEHLTIAPNHGAIVSFVDAPAGPVSKYPPGAAMLAAPLYSLVPSQLETITVGNVSRPEVDGISFLLPAIWPATLGAVLATAAAIAVLGLTFREIGSLPEAWSAAIIAGLGTSAWSVASAELFQHGPAMLWIALGVYLSSQQRYWTSGLAFAAAVLTRPITAVIPAAVGLGIGAYKRALTPTVQVGLASILGVAALLIYNQQIFGSLSLAGGYSDAYEQRLASLELVSFFKNLLGGLFDPVQGFMILSPFLLFLVPGLWRAWGRSDPWVRAAAIGGLVYLLLQFKLSRYNPANTTLYRYPLEALTASASLWFTAYLCWLKSARSIWRRLFSSAVVLAIGIQGIAIWLF